MAKRVAKAEVLGEWIKDNEFYDENTGEVKIPKNVQSKSNSAWTKHRWQSRYSRHCESVAEFLNFLASTKQDQMTDSKAAARLRRYAGQLEKQADRFEVGFEKSKARMAAAGK